MNDYGRRIVIDRGFEAAVDDVSRPVREEGMQTIARIDVRDAFWHDVVGLAAITDPESDVVARVLARLQHVSSRAPALPAV